VRIVALVTIAAALAGLGWWSPVVVLAIGPWLAAIAWIVLRNGPHVLIPHDDRPSGGENARRRLASP
jgi:CHASE2 domain-containing sensor protein